MVCCGKTAALPFGAAIPRLLFASQHNVVTLSHGHHQTWVNRVVVLQHAQGELTVGPEPDPQCCQKLNMTKLLSPVLFRVFEETDYAFSVLLCPHLCRVHLNLNVFSFGIVHLLYHIQVTKTHTMEIWKFSSIGKY